jgi:hypothetical protein
VFQEHNRGKIGIGILREKMRLEEMAEDSKCGNDNLSLEDTGASAWTRLIMTEIENNSVRVSQNEDGRSRGELLQDVSCHAAINAYSDPTMASDAYVSRGLRKSVPLLAKVNYRCSDGSTKPMTLPQARREMMRGGARMSSNTPPPIDFLLNSNTSNRMHRNGLYTTTAVGPTTNTAPPPFVTAPPVAVTNPAAPVSMVKRVMKRAGDAFFNGASSPATKIAAGKVRMQLSRGDVAYTSIVDDYEAEKNSQELFQYCLEQSTLE